MGVVSPIGRSVDLFRDALFAGRSGDRADLRSSIRHAAHADRRRGEMGRRRDARPQSIVRRARRRRQAMADARAAAAPAGRAVSVWALASSSFPWTTSRRGAVVHPARRRRASGSVPADAVRPLRLLICAAFDLRRAALTHVSACAAGTDAIGAAFRMLLRPAALDDGRRRRLHDQPPRVSPASAASARRPPPTTIRRGRPGRSTARARASCSAKAPAS